MTIVQWVFFFLNVTLISPAIVWMVLTILFDFLSNKSENFKKFRFPSEKSLSDLSLLEKSIWGFKDFYILWYSIIKKKKYIFKIRLENFDDYALIEKFCYQYYHYPISVRIKRLHSIISDSQLTSLSLHIDIEFLFEKDAAWFALHFGDKIV